MRVPRVVLGDVLARVQDDDHLHLVMDFLPGGDLMTLLIKYDIFP